MYVHKVRETKRKGLFDTLLIPDLLNIKDRVLLYTPCDGEGIRLLFGGGHQGSKQKKKNGSRQMLITPLPSNIEIICSADRVVCKADW